MDICRAFADRLAADFGIHVNPQDLIADGKLRHATPEGERPRSKKLAYKIHDDDRPVGWFEHYPTAQKASIKLADAPVMSEAERAESRRRWAQQRAREEAEQAARYDDRAAYAARLWAAAVPVIRHPYLDAKGIASAASVRLLERLDMAEFLGDPERRDVERGVLLIPVYSGPGVLRSLQAITQSRTKLNLAGGQQGGCYHPIKGTDPARILLCEGYATGAALHAATGHSVVCAMSAKNLPAVARIVAAQAKGREIVVCADNDYRTESEKGWNPGVDAGEDAAEAIGARVVWPAGCEGTDWDDWLREGGDPERLRRIVAGEVDPPPGEGSEPPEGSDDAAGQGGRGDEPDSHAVGDAIEGEVVDLPRTPSGSAYAQLTSWSALDLSLSDKGVPVANMDNAARLLERHPEMQGRFWFDEFQGRVYSTWNPANAEQEWSDTDDVRLALWMQRTMGIGRMAVGTARDAVTAVAMAHKRNEVHEWLLALEWDGVTRLSRMLPEAFGTVDTPYTQAVGRCWLVSMVARALDPGCKVDTMPVFEGDQGLRKSTAMQTLVGARWFAEASESPTSKDFYQVLTGKLLVEIAELDAFSKAEVNTIKRVVTCRVDRYRAPYGRRAEDHPRACVFAGTTNRDDWNRDETGARRFWPVACTAVDVEWLARHREQLFAEAVVMYQACSPWWDVPKEDAEREQEARRASDEWEEVIADWTVGKWEVTVGDVLEQALEVPPERWDKAMQMRVGNCLRVLGWKRETVRKGGKVLKAWVRGGNGGNDDPF